MATASADAPVAPSADGDGSQCPPHVQLTRFLYLNNDKCTFIRVTPVSLENIQDRLQCVLTMAQTRPDLPISIIRKVSNLYLL